MVAFVRAAVCRCKTSEPKLADEAGNIALERLCADPIFSKMCKEG